MTLLRLAISWARFYQVRWLRRRAERAMRRYLDLEMKAWRIERHEHIFLGMRSSRARSWRVPAYCAHSLARKRLGRQQ